MLYSTLRALPPSILTFLIGSTVLAQVVNFEPTPIKEQQSIPLLAIINIIVAIISFVFLVVFLMGVFQKLTSGGVEVLSIAAHKRMLSGIVGIAGTFLLYGIIILLMQLFG